MKINEVACEHAAMAKPRDHFGNTIPVVKKEFKETGPITFTFSNFLLDSRFTKFTFASKMFIEKLSLKTFYLFIRA